MKKAFYSLNKLILIFFLLGLLTCAVSVPFVSASDISTKNVSDMAGRSVQVSVPLKQVITEGSAPVENGFLMAIGEQNTIMNNIPDNFQKMGRWKYQYIFAPNLQNAPSIQATNNDPNVEEIIKLNPDAIFTMANNRVNTLEKTGKPVIVLKWNNETDAKQLMSLLGEVYDKQDAAKRYLQYFDETVEKINKTSENIPKKDRKTALYLSVKSMTAPLKIVDWWIGKAGGISVSNSTDADAPIGSEQINAWNPDVIIVSSPDEIETLLNDDRYASVNAVKNKEVYATPMGIHDWSRCGIETPLMVMWAAKTFYPDYFKELNLNLEVKNFYKEFGGEEITNDQVEEIMSGTAKIMN
jgi:iron complex transport system substrate-binding protein